MSIIEAGVRDFGQEEGIPSHLTVIDGVRWWFEKQGLSPDQVQEAVHIARYSEVPRTASGMRRQLTSIAEATTKKSASHDTMESPAPPEQGAPHAREVED